VAFGKATLGKRGYDEEQVDALLDEVSMEMIKLLEENAELERRADGAPPVTAAPGAAPGAAAGAQLATLSAQLDRALQDRNRAAQQADNLRRELDQARVAPAPAPPIVPPESVNRVLAMAQHTADQHLNDARQESEALLAEARDRSGRLVHEARDKADHLEQDATRRDTEAMTALEARRAAVVRDIDEMTSFAEGYQNALKDHMLRQQDHLGNTPRP
jgi:DivIVA domain-containing protein